MNKRMVEFVGEILVETERAVLFTESGDKDDAVWLPKSQIKIVNLDTSTDPVQAEIEVVEWLATKNEMV
ncbi:MAG: hypothetical protein SVY10_12225 [Thermodesulfobacteriota bacterium]|nr:hypothetical protein [Thermodesulfobacteriota bacterium]